MWNGRLRGEGENDIFGFHLGHHHLFYSILIPSESGYSISKSSRERIQSNSRSRMSNKVKGGLSLILLSICLTSVSALDCQFISDKFGINLDSFKFPINFDTIQDSPPTQNVFKGE